jgi:hypothetical protein
MANIHLASITLAITLWGSPPLDSTNPQPTFYDNRERVAAKNDLRVDRDLPCAVSSRIY